MKPAHGHALDTQLGTKRRTPPENESKRQLADVFCRVLGLTEVGVEDSFFELGGDSLRAVVAMQEIKNAIGFAGAPHVLFEHGTVRALARRARDSSAVVSRPLLLSDSPDLPPLFMLSGVHIYRQLARRMGGSVAAYGVYVDRELRMFDPTTGDHTVQDLALGLPRRSGGPSPPGRTGCSATPSRGLWRTRWRSSSGGRAGGPVSGARRRAAPRVDHGLQQPLAQLRRIRSADPGSLLSFVGRKLRRSRPSGVSFAMHGDDAKLGPMEASGTPSTAARRPSTWRRCGRSRAT